MGEELEAGVLLVAARLGLADPVFDPDAELIVRVGQGDPAAIQALMARKLSRLSARVKALQSA